MIAALVIIVSGSLHIYVLCVNNGSGENPRNMALIISSITASLNLIAIIWFFLREQHQTLLKQSIDTKRYWLRKFVINNEMIHSILGFFESSLDIIRSAINQPDGPVKDENIKKMIIDFRDAGYSIKDNLVVLEVIDRQVLDDIGNIIDEFYDEIYEHIERCSKNGSISGNVIIQIRLVRDSIFKLLYDCELNVKLK